MKKKSFVAVLLVVVLSIVAFLLSACSGKGGEQQTLENPGPQIEQSGGSGGGSNTDGGGSGGGNSGGPQQNTPSNPRPAQYTVTYHAQGGKFTNDSDTLTQTATAGSKLNKPADPKRTGYTFGGWATDTNGAPLWRFATDTVTNNTDLYAVWKQEPATLVGVTGATIEGRRVFMVVEDDITQVSLSDKVTCSDDSKWSLYADADGQTPIPTKRATSLQEGDNAFYIFVETLDGTKSNDYDLIIHRKYEVDINYYFGQKVLKTETIYTSNQFEADYVPNITGYTFNCWKDEKGEAVTSFTVWEERSLYADATANTYTVYLNAAGGEGLDEADKTMTYDSEYTLPTLTRTGYTFLGWYEGETKLTNADGQSIAPWTFDEDNKDITAKWQVNKYNLTVERSNSAGGTVTGGGNYDYGTEVKITATTNPGYTFIGWYKDNERVSTELEYPVTIAATDETYTAKWIKVTLEATAGGNITTILDGTYTAGEQVELDAEMYLGYHFVGWYSGSKKVYDDMNYTITMPEVDTTYTATWEVNDEMSNFEFTSTATTCTITGVKNKVAQSVTIPEYVTSINSNVFSDCFDLKAIEVAPDNNVYSGRSGILYNKRETEIIYVPLAIEVVDDLAGNITSIDRDIFANHDKLKEITIPASVTSIGSSAFDGCSGLTKVNITDLAAWCNINFGSGSANPLYYAHSLYINDVLQEEIIIPQEITKIRAYTFNGCNATSVAIHNGVTSIGNYAFYDCSSLTEITIPTSVTSIGGSAFEDCTNLQTVTFAGNSTLKSIGNYAFYDCSSLTEIKIPASVTSIGVRAFQNCTNLQTVNWNATNCTEAGSYENYVHDYTIFKGCTSLTTVNIGANVQTIPAYAFYGCGNLTSITIPENVTSIGSWAFLDCTNLQTVNWNATNCTKAGSYNENASKAYTIFKGCTSLTTVNIGENVQTIPDYAFCECSKLTEITIPASVTTIGGGAFDYCTNLETVNWNATNCTRAGAGIFSDCTSLTTVNIGENVKTIPKYAFENCSNLTSITIPASVTSIGGRAFDGCKSLTSITIPASVTSIGGNAFEDCTNLRTVTFAGNSTLKSIGNYAFYDCSSLTEIKIPASVTSIGGSAFSGCSSLTEITLPFVGEKADGSGNVNLSYIFDSVPASLKTVIITGGESIGESAFRECSGLTSVTIPASVTSIGYCAFYKCTNLQTVMFADDSQLESIGIGAFEYCSGLTSITIPASVTTIGGRAFYGCDKFETAIFEEPNGWIVVTDDKSSSVSLSSELLQNASTAAEYLRDGYRYNKKYYWYWERS